MKRMLTGLVALVFLFASVARADDSFKVEYVSGKKGFETKIQGTLVISDQTLTMMDGKGVVFEVPLKTVTRVSSRVETINQNSFIRLNKNMAFVSVTTESADAAESILFTIDPKLADGLVAKIEFAAKKVKTDLGAGQPAQPAPKAPAKTNVPEAPQPTEVVIPSGTDVKVRLTRDLTSATAKAGESIEFSVTEDVVVNGCTVIQRAAPASGRILNVTRQLLSRGGKLEITVDSVKTVNGEIVPVRGRKSVQGNRTAIRAEEATIPSGTSLVATSDGDRSLALKAAPNALPQRGQSPSIGEKQAEPQKPTAQLTIDQVIQMVVAKLPDDIIIATIQKSPSKFELTPETLIKLKAAGVSDAVIRAMTR
jgi:hypothetical protein